MRLILEKIRLVLALGFVRVDDVGTANGDRCGREAVCPDTA